MKNVFKRISAFIVVIMLLSVIFAIPSFAITGVSGCTSMTTDDSEQCQIAKAIGDDLAYSSSKDTANGYSYDIMVSINGQSKQIWLKQRPEVDNFNVHMDDDGGLNVMGIGTGDSNQWNNLFSKYKTAIVGISGIGAITMIAFFIINFMKLGASAGNPQARSQALTGVLWTGLAAAGLGSVSIVAGFFYNAI